MTTIDTSNFGNAILSPLYSDKNQSIYGSQLYGTSFDVYAQFKVNKDKSIAQMDLQLLNYKGVIDLGFVDTTPAKCTCFQVEQDGKKLNIIQLDITLKAVVGKGTSYTKKVDLSDGIKGAPLKSKDPYFLVVKRELIEMWPQHSGDNPLEEGIFDSEFFLRDGTHFIRKAITEVPENFYNGKCNTVYPKLTFGARPGLNCGIGTNNVVIE